ncbi:cytochrome c6 [filamentous cyanobacterium CCP5]|nr:cytochrome c6 [filamentous cyanobacterium CCP5]
MKSLLVRLWVACLAFTWLLTAPAFAADLGHGAEVFKNNCAACHMGGGNVVNGAKTLKQDALEKYDMASVEAIRYQIANGKNAMPAFRGRLSEDQIDDVAAYVLSQAESGW